jgi:vitamin B12 transporter
LYHQAGGKLNIELGGRLNVHSRYGSNHTFTFNPSYNITEHFRIFGSIASGFKAPALFQLFGPNRPAATILKPERSTTYEAGVQHQYAKFQNRVVLFYRTINDGLDFNYNNFQYFNFLRQQVKGIEWEASVQPVKGLQISANYTFLSAEETTQSRLNFKDTVYTYLLRRPNHQVNLMAGYQFNNSLYFSVSGRFVSDRFDVGGYQKSDALLGSYVLFNAYAAYSFGTQLKLFADAQNIGNKKFFDVYGYNSIPFLFHTGFVVNL